MFKENNCTVCGDCLTWCPYIDICGQSSKEEFQKLIEGTTSRITLECVSCMGCDEICPEKAYPFSLILRRQEEQKVVNSYEKAKLNMEGAYSLPSEILRGPKRGPVIDVCTVYPLIPNLFDGILCEEATFLRGGDFFCGVGFYHIGIASKVEQNAASVVKRVAETGAQEVVCYHDDCYTFFKVIAPKLGVRVPFDVISWPEFLYNRMKKLKDRIRPIEKPVAYQRPCASRYTPEKDSYIDAIFDLIGVTRPLRKYDRLHSLCCGGAIVPRNLEMANTIKHRNLEDAKAAGAEIMVTLCPICFANLRKRAPEHDLSIMPISNLCRLSLGELTI